MDANLAEFFPIDGKDNLCQISPQQLQMIETFHSKIFREEDILSSRMTTLQVWWQEDIGKLSMKSLRVVGELNEDVECAINAHNVLLASLIRDADRLRVTILKDLMESSDHAKVLSFLFPLRTFTSLYTSGERKGSAGRAALHAHLNDVSSFIPTSTQ